MFASVVWALMAFLSSGEPVRVFADPPRYPSARMHGDVLVTYDGHGWRRTGPDGNLVGYVEWTHAHAPIAWSPDLRLILAQSVDRSVAPPLFLHVSGGAPIEVASAARGRRAATCSNTACAATTSTTEVTIWDDRGAARHTVPVAQSRAAWGQAITLSQDGRWLAAAEPDHAWVLFDLIDASRRVAVSLTDAPSPGSLEFSPTADRILLNSNAGVIEYATMYPRISRARPGRVHFAAYTADGRVALRQPDGRPQRWDQGERFEHARAELAGAQAIAAVERHPTAPWSAALDAGGRVWAVEDGAAAVAMPAKALTAIRWLHTHPATLIATDAAGRLLRWRPGQPPDVLTQLQTPAQWLATAEDAVLVAHGKTAALIDGRSGEQRARWQHEAVIDGIAFETRTSRPWKAIVRGGEMPRRPVEPLPSGIVCGNAQQQRMPRYSTWHPDQGLRLTSSVQNDHYWPVLSRAMHEADGRIGGVVPVKTAVKTARLADDGSAIITGHGIWPALLHSLPMTNATVLRATDEGLLAGDAQGGLHRWIRHTAPGAAPRSHRSSVMLTEAGDHLVLSARGWMQVFDLTTRRLIWRGRWGETTAGAAISPTGSAIAHVDTLGQVHVRDLGTQKEWTSRLRLPGQGSWVHPHSVVSWRPDGQTVALTDRHGLVLIERATGAQRALPIPGAEVLTQLAWARDGQTVYAASAHTVWAAPLNGDARALLRRPVKEGFGLSRQDPINGLAVSTDGARLLVRRMQAFDLLSLPDGQPASEPIGRSGRMHGPVVFLDAKRFLDADHDGLGLWTKAGLVERIGGSIPRRHALVALGRTHRVIGSDGAYAIIDADGAVQMRMTEPSDTGLAWQADGRFECTDAMCDRVGIKTPQGWQFGPKSAELRARRGWAN